LALPHPLNEARPTEWLMRSAESQPPYGVIRRFLFGDPNRAEEWYRVVTWSPSSEERELVGWCRTLETACALAWDFKCAHESWRHHMASRRISVEAMREGKPTAAEMVTFYRNAKRRQAG
jgi:hypothetical protein